MGGVIDQGKRNIYEQDGKDRLESRAEKLYEAGEKGWKGLSFKIIKNEGRGDSLRENYQKIRHLGQGFVAT